jgi:hypothetical protein
MAANHPLTLAFILESGDQVVILEGVAAAVTGAGRLQAFLDAYNPKHDWDAAATDDEGVTDSAGAAGPAYRVRPGSSSAATSTCTRRPAGPSPTPPRL